MGQHLYSVAATLPLPPVEKLVLLCMADDAPDKTRIAAPGMATLAAWTGRNERNTAAAVARLIGKGWIANHVRGRKGTRARWIVFPEGCCDRHSSQNVSSVVPLHSLSPATGYEQVSACRQRQAMGDSQPVVGMQAKNLAQPVASDSRFLVVTTCVHTAASLRRRRGHPRALSPVSGCHTATGRGNSRGDLLPVGESSSPRVRLSRFAEGDNPPAAVNEVIGT